MAADTNISMAAAKAALDAVVDRLDTGTGANARLRMYTGTQPGRPDDAIGTQQLVVEIDLGAAAVFGNAATGTGTEANTAVATASGILPKSGTAATTGTVTWFRAVNKGGTAVIDGSAGESNADLIVDNASINSGQTVKLNSWKVRMPAE